MFENATNPTKWITNYKYKTETDSLSKVEKELEFACRLIEERVVEVKPRRHGKGSIFINWNILRVVFYPDRIQNYFTIKMALSMNRIRVAILIRY